MQSDFRTNNSVRYILVNQEYTAQLVYPDPQMNISYESFFLINQKYTMQQSPIPEQTTQ